MITTLTQWRVGVHFGHRIYPTGVTIKWNRTQSKLITQMCHGTYSQSYHMVSEWRPIFPLRELLLSGGSENPQARPLAKKSFQGRLFEPITGFWRGITQYRIQ